MAENVLKISLNLDSSGVAQGAKQVKKNLEQLEQKAQETSERLEGATQSLSANLSKVATTAKSAVKTLRDVEKGAGEAFEAASKAYSYVVEKGADGEFMRLTRKTDPYRKSGAIADFKDIRRLNADISRNAGSLITLVKNGVEGNAKSLALQQGITREVGKQVKLMREQLSFLDNIKKAKKHQRELQRDLRIEEERYDKMAKATPQYVGKKQDFIDQENKIIALRKQLGAVGNHIATLKASPVYASGLDVLRKTRRQEESVLDLATRRALEDKRIADALKEQSLALKQQRADYRGVLADAKKHEKLQRSILANNQRRIANYRNTMRGGLMDVAYGMGGMYVGEKAISGMFQGTAGLQKIESQVDTWRLSKQERVQFDAIADRLMMTNPLLNRKEALDATLAGMTSMGHFDANSLKMVLPKAVEYAQGSRMLGYTDDTISNVIKNYFGVVEARQQTLDPTAMLKTFKTLWQIENVTGGKVTVKDFETILRNLGPGAPLLSDEGLLNLVAFAEQIKVAGHGGGGGAGAGISTVGNLIKMLQLTAAGKPTSINAKKMMSELYTVDEEGNKIPLLDIDRINKNEATGGMTLVQSMSSMKNIGQTAMQLLLGADKDIAKAGFREKAGMWSDPIRTMGAMREAFLRETQRTPENIRKYYDANKIGENGQLKDVDVLDEQKAISSLIAQMGFQHRTTAAMSIFMNPFFLKRSGYTLSSAQRQEDPLAWMQEQYGKGNWNVASQEFEAAITRLEESARPLVEIFADITRSVAAFIKQIALFNEDHPILTVFNGLGVMLVGMAPALGMAALGFGRLLEMAKSYVELNKQLQLQPRLVGKVADATAATEIAKQNLDATAPTKRVSSRKMAYQQASGEAVMQGAAQRAVATTAASKGGTFFAGMTSAATRELRAAGAAIDGFLKNINLKLAALYKGVFGVVGKIGGLFMRMIPVVGTALLAWDFGSIVASWISDIEVEFDGQTKRLGDHIEAKWKELEASWAVHRRHAKETEAVISAYETQNRTNDQFLDLKGAVSAFKASGNAEENLGEEYGYKTVGEVFEIARQNGWLSTEFNENLGGTAFNFEKLNEALVKAEVAERDARVSLEKLADSTTMANGSLVPGASKAFNVAQVDSELFMSYSKTYKDMIEALKNATIDSTLFNSAGNDKAQTYNLLAYRDKVVSIPAETEEEKNEKREELARIDQKIIEITQDEAVAFQDLIAKIRSSEDSLGAFAEFVRDLVKEHLGVLNQSGLFADSILMTSRIGDAIAKGESLARDMNKLSMYDANEKGHAFSKTKLAQAKELEEKLKGKNAAGGGGSLSYFVPQNVQLANTLKSQYEQAMADINSLVAGEGKKGREYAEAVIMQKWLNGKFSLSKLNPHQSPFMKTQKGGLSPENLSRTKKDQTGRTFDDYVDLQFQADQAKLLATAVEKFAQESGKARESYEAARELVSYGGIEKLPTAIATLDKEIAKQLTPLSNDNPLKKTAEEFARAARARTSATAINEQTAESLRNTKAMRTERLSYGLSSTNASRAQFDQEWDEKRKAMEHLIDYQKQALVDFQGTDEELRKMQDDIVNRTKAFNKEYEEALAQWQRNNATAGENLVNQWTDLGRQLDELQTTMMESFISITEDFLDDNLGSWRDYANSLLSMMRRQIMQSTLSPLFSMLTSGIGYGISTLVGNDVEAQRQQNAFNQAGNVANSLLGAILGPVLGKVFGNSGNQGGAGQDADTFSEETQSQAQQAGNNQIVMGQQQYMQSLLGMTTATQSAQTGFMDMNTQVAADTASIITSTALREGLNALNATETGLEATQQAIMPFINIELETFSAFLGQATGQLLGFIAALESASVASAATAGFANGGIMTSDGAIDLKRYAGGGIAKQPQLALFGEGSMNEAFVPLPDGRSIPVTIRSEGATTERMGANNVTINISVDARGNGGSSGGDTNDATTQSREANENATDFTKLANRIKTVVRQEIAVQSRPGGLLART